MTSESVDDALFVLNSVGQRNTQESMQKSLLKTQQFSKLIGKINNLLSSLAML